jgi:hypothetical protein
MSVALRYAASVTPLAGTHASDGDVLDEHGLIGLRDIVGHVTRAASGSFPAVTPPSAPVAQASIYVERHAFLGPSHLFCAVLRAIGYEVVFDVPDGAASSGASS